MANEYSNLVDHYQFTDLDSFYEWLGFWNKSQRETILPDNENGYWNVSLFEETLSDGSKVLNLRIT